MADKVDLVQIHQGGDYGSEFEYDSEVEKNTARRQDLAQPEARLKTKLPSSQAVTTEYNLEENRRSRIHLLTLDAFSRHKKFINDYLLYYGGDQSQFGRDASRDRRDIDIIRENHKFLWDEDEDDEDTWEKRMAKKYHDKLFKEYCIADLSRYKENKVAMRWRIEKEVVVGKGQFICGNKRCGEQESLRTWELNFAYMEHGEKKNALVKLRLCPECSYKLNYHHKKKEVTKKKKEKSKKRKSEEHSKSSSGKKSKRDEESSTSRQDEEGRDSSVESSVDATESCNPPTNKEGHKEGIWAGPAKIVEDKSRAEEFEDYFEDMFL